MRLRGESIVVFAVLKQGYAYNEKLVDELKRHVRETIGPIATPDEVYFVSKLPKTRSGKIMRRILKAVVSGKPIGDATTLEDETSVEEAKRIYEEFKKIIGL